MNISNFKTNIKIVNSEGGVCGECVKGSESDGVKVVVVTYMWITFIFLVQFNSQN